MSDIRHNAFYKAGKRAYRTGLDLGLCPLTRGPAAKTMWRKGWRDAENVETKFGYFEKACRAQARLQWDYQGLVDEHPDAVDRAFAVKQSPEDLIRQLGETDGLRPPGDWPESDKQVN